MNTKKEEESVRLDLGNTEEEEEVEESDYEDSEIQEEESEDEGIVDLNVDYEEEKVVEQLTVDKNLEEEIKSELNIVDASQIKDNPENELELEHDENQFNSQISNNHQIETASKGAPKKKKNPGVSGSSQRKNKMNSDLSHISPNKKRSENTEKTVFTRISEDLFNKFISNKDFYNKKTSSYDYLINDMFLNRVVEKNDRESAAKFNDFVNRNREFRDKKQMKLQERSEKIATEMNATYTGRPNGKVFEKTQIRDPQEYLQDQLKYYQTRDQNIKQQQEDIIKNTDSNIKKVPDISKKSKQLAEKRLTNDNTKEVHDRLFNDKLHKDKKHLYTEKSGFTQVSKITTIPQKKTREEIKDLVEKLYKDAETRRENKEKTQNDKLKLKEVYHVYGSDDELSSSKTNLKILDKFVDNFRETSFSLFEKSGSFPILFQDFTNILVHMGFINYTHDLPNHGEDLNKTDNEKRIRDKEMKLVKDAWKILLTGSNNSNKMQNQDKVSEENTETVDTYQVIVFLASILGLYKGEHSSEQTNGNVNNSQILNTFAPTEGNQNEKVDTIPFSDVVEGTLPNGTPQGKNLSTFGHSTVSPKKEEKKKTKSNRFSTSNENTYKNTFSNMVNGSFSVTSQRKSKILSDTKNKKPHKNLFKVVIPDLDTKKYQYFRSTVKQIKSLFRVMYDNRIHFIVEAKKKKMVDKLNQLKIVSEESLMKQTSFASESLRQSADNFRKRIYQEVESEILSKEESHQGGKVGRTLRLDEVYDILRKKKENEIAKLKIQMQEEEMIGCTFQPNVDRKDPNTSRPNVKQTISRLYDEGLAQTKEKIKKADESKNKDEIIDANEFTFAPKVNPFKSQVFEVNPLIHDKFVEKEVKRFEKARIERKIIEIQKKKGINNLKTVKNLEELLVDEDYPSMTFEIEKRTFKDNIDSMNRSERRNNSSGKKSDFMKTVVGGKSVIKQTAREPILNIEVNIDDNNRIEKLEIYPNDDAMNVADEFCSKYGLSEDKKLRLQKIIEEKLLENLGSNSGRL